MQLFCDSLENNERRAPKKNNNKGLSREQIKGLRKKNKREKGKERKGTVQMKRKKEARKNKERKINTAKETKSSCPRNAPVSSKCLENAMISLKYEKNQVTNYLKQSKRLTNHQNISSNKLTKKDEFESAAKHMLWAIGGNLSDPKCGEETNDTKRKLQQNRDLKSSIANYETLKNCSETIREACDLSLKRDTYSHEDHLKNMTLCSKYKTDFMNVSKECVSMKSMNDADLQCACWARAAKDVEKIKKLNCETKSKQAFVTKHKNDCIKAFGKCKKMEDDAIELIHRCMHDHANKFINQTGRALNEETKRASKGEYLHRLADLGFEF